MQSVLQISDAETLKIVAIRLGHDRSSENAFLDEILEIEEAVDCLDKAEEKQVRDEKAYAKSAKAMQYEFVSKYRAKSSSVRAAQVAAEAAAAPKARAKGRARVAAVPGPGGEPPAPPRDLPAGDLLQADLKLFAPPGGFVWRANKQGSWQGHYPPFRRVSYSWHQHGHRFAGIKVLRHLWSNHLTVHNLRIPQDCTVRGLFDAQANELASAQVLG